MKQQFEQLIDRFREDIRSLEILETLDEIENKYFSRKHGAFTELMKGMKDLADDTRKEVGQFANEVKTEMEELLGMKKKELRSAALTGQLASESIDVTQPKLPAKELGHIHPVTQTMWELEDIYRSMGFIVEDGPEIESDYYLFTALNIPEHHPARDAQDTFYIKDHPNWTMRSHVSGMQVRQMRKYGAPLRAAHVGRVFRNEAVDATHGHTFNQFDAILVDKDITMGHLIGFITTILEKLYKRKVELRIRTGYFPFVEPGFEIEMKMTVGAGAQQKTKWIEIAPGGIVHPNVIKAGGLDPEVYDGFAFSLGVDRLVMAKYGIEDLRNIYAGDLRFLEQF